MEGKEDFNIYENQIIKYSLIQIKKEVEKYINYIEKRISYDSDYLETLKLNMTNQYKIDLNSKKYELNNTIQRKRDNASNELEQVGFIECLEIKKKDLEKLKNILQEDKLLKEVIEKIDKLLELDLFKNIKLKKDILKPTQIFINDFSYNKVFRELKNLNEKYNFLDGISPEMYFLKGTANIYENWCLYKIVDILINEMGWRLLNKDDVMEDIDKLLKYTGKWDRPSVTIKLEHKIHNNRVINLDLIYEGKIYYDKNKYKTPDYQFRFNINGYEKIVYLDAKYRDYYTQGNKQFMEDINSVAIGKYYVPFVGTVNSSDVSFIVHSDKKEKYNCFGGNHIISDYQLKDSNYTNSFFCKEYETNKHRFGAFYLLPSYTYNLNKFLKMIMEYHLGLYNICWNCGEVDDINIEPKITVGGNKKYHYRCNKCNEFWVKNHCYQNKNHSLIKHLDNYHSVNNNKYNPWYVICPVCFSGME